MRFHFPLSHEKCFLFPSSFHNLVSTGSQMCLFSFCTDFLLPNKLCSSFTKPLLIPTAISMITETPSPHLDVFPALPKTIDVTTASLKAFLTSPATFISATNHSAIHSVSMFAITNHPFHVSMPHLFIRFWSLIWQGLKLISKFWKIMHHRNQEDPSKTSLYCLISCISLLPTQLQSWKVTNCVLFM